MSLNKPLLISSIATGATLDSLVRGLERLREFGGYVYHPEDASRQTSSFWFSPSSCGFREGQERNTDNAVQDYQTIMLHFKLARSALIAMSQSLELEMYKLREKMQPAVLSRGIANVPDEILARILLFSTMIDFDGPRYSESFRLPVRIGQVCKRFNNIINTQPEIWSYVSSRMGSKELTTRLTRSRAVGLKISFVGDLEFSRELAKFESALKILLPHAARWEELHLGVRYVETVDSLREFNSKREFPRLQSIAITGPTRRYPHEPLNTDAMCGNWTTPQLCGLSAGVVFPTVPIAARVTELRLQAILDQWRFEDLQIILNTLSSSLTRLWLGFCMFRPDVKKDLTVRLPYLRTMHLDFNEYSSNSVQHDDSGKDIDHVYEFVFFKTPELEHLTVTLSSVIICPWWMSRFLSRLSEWQRSSAKLRYLNVIDNKRGTQSVCKDEQETNVYDVLHSSSSVEFIKFSKMRIGCLPPSNNSEATSSLKAEGPSCLRHLHLDGCVQTKKQITEHLRILTDDAAFPKFEQLVLSNCTGIKWGELMGLKGLEYLVIRDE